MSPTTWMAIVAGGLITFAERFSSLAVAERTAQVPPEVREALRMIPAAALAGLVAPAVVRGGEDGAVDPARIVAGVVAFAIMWRTRQVVTTLLVGLGVLIGLERIW